jgi:glycosyltransferase involved in cell wall biosynthesis
MKNESDSLPFFIDQIQDIWLQTSCKISAIIVDNGSTDDTELVIAKLPQADHILFLKNPYGASYADGLEYAIRKTSSPYVLILPSDLQFVSSDVVRVVNAFHAKLQGVESGKKVAIFTSRGDRSDGLFMRFRGAIWRNVVLKILSIDHKLDPASQLKIIPTPKEEDFTSRNFLWDIESLLWSLRLVQNYEVVRVGFISRPYGESSLSKNLIVSTHTALRGLLRLRRSYLVR